MKFLVRVKKHQQYLYVSILLIVIFFLGNSLITPKITSVTENLIEDIVQGNLKSKEKIIAFEFNQLNSFILDSEKIIDNSLLKEDQNLKEKLQFTSDLAASNTNITNSFVCFLNDSKIDDIIFSGSSTKVYKHTIIDFVNTIEIAEGALFIDDIVKEKDSVFNRKILLKKLSDNRTIITGYVINLISFWKYFSEDYKGEGGYAVVTNSEGVCLLHPETKFIGVKLNSFFKNVDIEDVLQKKETTNDYYTPNNSNNIKIKTTSSFLGLEVLRYYNTVKVGESSLIVIVSFPVDIYLKESIVNIKRYFSWISMLAFVTFMLMLGISRLQLRKEFNNNLKVVEEKEQLAIANEKYQRKNAELQLNQLKKKMNPHFLFNSLNSLHVLIDLNTELSQQFVLKLADVYRYLLEDKENNLISVKKELDFLKQYIFLQEIRFNNSLNISITYNCEPKKLNKKIPFLALETLVENAIKHNEITKQNPLSIEVIINNEEIIVLNNYNPRKINEQNSHHIGLNYLKNSYEYYQINSFKTEIIDGKFKCFLPLLS